MIVPALLRQHKEEKKDDLKPLNYCQFGVEFRFKSGFFSESVIRFLISKSPIKNIPKNYPELEI